MADIPMAVKVCEVEMHFWFAPGVEVAPGQHCDNPPPFAVRVAVRMPLPSASLGDDETPGCCPWPQAAGFRLAEHSPWGEVAHYNLDAQPPHGWRWIVIDKRIHAERR